MEANNPAARLYRLLDDLRSQPDGSTLEAAWSQVLNIDVNNLDDLLIQYSELTIALQFTKSLIGKQKVDHRLYLKPFIKIQRVFTLGLRHQVANAKEHLDEATMVGLEHCAELLSRTSPEKIIDAKVLAQLQMEIDGLIEKVIGSTLPDSLRLLILDNLHRVRQAILNYRIHGARGIEDALENAYGSVFVYSKQVQIDDSTNIDDKKLVHDYISLLEQCLSIVANALNIGQLTTSIAGFLLGK